MYGTDASTERTARRVSSSFFDVCARTSLRQGAPEESSFRLGPARQLAIFGTISLSHLPQSAAPARAQISFGATAAQGQPSLATGSTASISVHGQHSITTHSS